jgi:hypothetical protein
MLIIDVSEVKLTEEAKQNNLPPECGQPIDGGQVWGPSRCECPEPGWGWGWGGVASMYPSLCVKNH